MREIMRYSRGAFGAYGWMLGPLVNVFGPIYSIATRYSICIVIYKRQKIFGKF